MGVTNQFEAANDYLREKLGYHLDPRNADKFRGLLNLAGIRRVRHAVDTVALQGLSAANTPDIHRKVTDQIWALMPPKKTKYRNPHVQAMNVAQKRELEYAMAKDGD